MSLPLKWEFPGGKIDSGESEEECLRREIAEELGILVKVGLALPPHTHQYDTFFVTLYPFICTIKSGKITLREHAALIWLSPQELNTLDWADADISVVGEYLQIARETHT